MTLLIGGITLVKLNKENRQEYTNLVLETLETIDIELFRKIYLDLHPSDQADIFSMLSNEKRQQVYEYLSPAEFSITFENLILSNQLKFYPELHQVYFYDMLNNMFTDNVVNFLSGIDDKDVEEALNNLSSEKANKIRVLLSYQEETAGAVMTKEFISISSTATAENVIEQLRGEAPNAEIIYYNYVIDNEGVLVGVVSLRDLIIAPPTEIVENIMSTRVVSVPDNMDQEEVAKMIKKYDLLAVPVISKESRLLGIVTVDDIMDIVEVETTEDFGEISATKGAIDINVSPFVAARKRSPWIIALMFFGLVTGSVIGWFEDTLESVVLLAVFIPLIMDSAGNVGTQSLGVAVRGIALGTIEKGHFWKMIRREFSTGAMIGVVCMLTISLIIMLFYGSWILGLVVGFSIFFTLSASAVIGSTVPLIIDKLNFDPAIASGPFITTVNDIIGLLIYFSIATALMDVL